MRGGLYIYERNEWPHFTYDAAALAPQLDDVRFKQGLLVGRLEALGVGPRQEATLEALVQEVRRSSEIEGEILNWEQVRSSIGRRLGVDVAGLSAPDRHVEAIVDVVLDATENFSQPLTKDRLFNWHGAPFPTGRSGLHQIVTAAWRDDRNGPMQVVSGAMGHEKVHFQAPAAETVDAEMARFLQWFETQDSLPGVLKAAIAHLWFVTIHPFDDGNGRIGRAILDMALARSENRAWRGYSLSAQIQRERNQYYDALERAQKGMLDITPYLEWFLDCLQKALSAADDTLSHVLTRARFWQSHAATPLNPRQALMLKKLLEGFEGKLTNAKWVKITKCSPDTALRDLNDLVAKNILERDEGEGRSAGYRLVLSG